VTNETWARFFDEADPVHALVAEVDGRLVGLTHYLFHPATNQSAPLCYLSDLFTASDARGQGIGRALIEGVCARAKEAGANRVYWQTHESNATARLLYDRVAELSGFIVYRKVL
jgi:GNAT superfamily N-acetyltransferase